MWVLKLLLPPVKIRIFGPKRAKFSLKYAFIGTYRHCRFIWCTVALLVGDCGARAVSRKTPISFIHFKIFHSEEFLGQDKKKGHFLSQMISSKIVFNCDVSTRRGAGGDKEVVNPVLERWTSPNTTIFSSSCSWSETLVLARPACSSAFQRRDPLTPPSRQPLASISRSRQLIAAGRGSSSSFGILLVRKGEDELSLPPLHINSNSLPWGFRASPLATIAGLKVSSLSMTSLNLVGNQELYQCFFLALYYHTRSSWLNCALRAVYWVSVVHYEAVAVGDWWHWVSRGHLCLYILHKEEIWSSVTDAFLTDRLWKIVLYSAP